MRYSNKNLQCQIWPAFEARGHRDSSRDVVSMESSRRAGGQYDITYEAISLLEYEDVSIKERALLTTMLVDQRKQGIVWPLVTTELVRKARTNQSITVDQRGERLLRFISSQEETLASLVDVREESYEAYAWSESIEWGEVVYLLDYLQEMGWIQGQRSGEGWFQGQLTVHGHGRIAEQRINIDSTQAFVAMWFDEKMNELFEGGIEPAIKQAGFKPLRIDRKEHVNKIDDEIIAEIRRSRFLVADFTHGCDGARGGVYYEAGFASGLGIPVFYTCRRDLADKLHFDTRQFNHILWESHQELHESLRNRIVAVIGEGPEKFAS